VVIPLAIIMSAIALDAAFRWWLAPQDAWVLSAEKAAQNLA
jgi:hypothetical protein